MKSSGVILSLLLLAAFAACGGNSRGIATTPTATYDDVTRYCDALGTVDEPDQQWTGSTVPREVIDAATAHFGPRIVADNSVLWRCLNHDVVWCMYWGTNHCPKGDLDTSPNPMIRAFCSDERNRGAGSIGRADAGATIWHWRCQDGTPVIVDQAIPVDERGFPASIWQVLTRDGSDELVPIAVVTFPAH
jgi:hypothetical protein